SDRDGATASEIEEATPILVKMLVASRGDISVLVAACRNDGLVMTTAGSANDAIFQDLTARGWAAPADIGLDIPGIASRAYAITPAGKGPVDRLIAEWETRMRADDLMIERLNRIRDEVGPRIARDLEAAVAELGGEGLDASFALSRAVAIFASRRGDPQGLIDSIAANAKNDAVLRRTGDPTPAP
ncbi:MAG: hypothetical protein JWL96_4224, partial [Sphingomonas bacterium]|uniref:hypothetical protein n=1 Tax=Sphingomonas bacterium TaxID=1895847 RepID=UPI00260C3588